MIKDFASEARFETSTLCNNNCVFCPHRNLIRKKEIMSFDLFKSLISKLKDEPITEITFSGFGEIFTDSSILEKIIFAKTAGYNVNILTNGTLLNKEKCDVLLKYVDNIRISVHTIDRQKYTQITNSSPEMFDNMYENIVYLVKNKTSRIILTAVTYDDFSLKDFTQDADVEIWKPHNWTNAFSYRQNKLVKKTCGRFDRGPLQIQVDGTVNACCFDYNGLLLLGDLKKQSIQEIFSSEKYRVLKNEHENGKHSSICKYCDQRMDYDGLIYSTLNKSNTERENMFSSTYNKIKE